MIFPYLLFSLQKHKGREAGENYETKKRLHVNFIRFYDGCYSFKFYSKSRGIFDLS